MIDTRSKSSAYATTFARNASPRPSAASTSGTGPVHVDVGEHPARDAAVRRAARVALATNDAPAPRHHLVPRSALSATA